MRFKKYLKEIKWQRRQLRKGKPYWVYDKYEITKEPDGTFKMVDISQMTGNKPKEIGTFDSLKKAKESINEYSGGTPVSQVMYGAYGGELRRAAKTGHSRDYTGSSGKNISGIAAPIEVYYDELDPRNIKKRKKRNFLTMYNRMM